MADGSLPVVVCPEAFGRAQFDLTVLEGTTVGAMLVEAVRQGLPVENLCRAEIYIDGERLPRETATDYVLSADEVVSVVVEPLGGGGGGRKNVGQILLQIAVIAVAAWVGGGAGGQIASKLIARMAAAAVTVVGNLAVNALFAPDNKVTKANDRYALQNASNQYRAWGPQPIALGEVITAPDLAAKTFTESIGDDVWMYGILGVHRGPCEIEDLKIGDTLASSMGYGDWRMVAHLEPGPRTFSIYPNDVDQLDLTEKLEATPYSATPVVRASSSDGSRFDFDIYLPEGLYFGKSDGRIEATSVGVNIRYRPVDSDGIATGDWANAPSWSRWGSSKDPQRVTHRVTLPHGRYEFEVKRTSPTDVNDKRHDTVVWTALKSVAFRKPVVDEQLSIIEFAVRASAVNQGGLAPITCKIKPKFPCWNGMTWGEPEVTSNPAAAARWLMTGPCAAQPLSETQADAGLRVWYHLCEEYNWTCHHYLTERRSQEEALALLEKSGRASIFWDGTQLQAACWVEKPAPKQMFTGVNLKDHSFEIGYPDPVHALRVEFANMDKAGEPDELFVYMDGYGEAAGDGIEAATLIEGLRLDGQMMPERAYRDGRWALGQRIHQRRVDSWTCDAEYLVSSYGDRVRLAWDRANGPSGRVRARRMDGANVIGLRLDQPVEMTAGRNYVVDFRTVDGIVTAVPVETVAGWQRELTFTTPRAAAASPKRGDLVAFGEPERVTEDVEIIAVAPGPNLTAQLVGIRYVAPLLMAGETGEIPPLTSRLSLDRNRNPPQPVLLGTQVDANGVRVSFDMGVWRGSPLSGFTVRWRSVGGDDDVSGWENLPALDANARILRTPPLREAPVDVDDEEATRAQIEIVATTVDGRASKPLLVTVRQTVPPLPVTGDWTVTRMPPSNGQQLPFLQVSGQVDDPEVAQVRIAYSQDDEGPWTDAYIGPPKAVAYPVGPLKPGVAYYVLIQFLSAQGTPSGNLVKGPVIAPGLVTGATSGLVHILGEEGELSAEVTVHNVAAGSHIEISGQLLGGRLTNNTNQWEGQIAISEATNDEDAAFLINKTEYGTAGTAHPDGGYNVALPPSFSVVVLATLGGSVTYTVSCVEALFNPYLDLPTIDVRMVINPPVTATPGGGGGGAPVVGATVLADLLDVDMTGAADGQVLTYDSATGLVTPQDLPAGGGGGATELADLDDVDLAGITNGQGLAWDAAASKLKPVTFPSGGVSELADLSDVDMTGVSDLDLLVYDAASGKVVPAPLGSITPVEIPFRIPLSINPAMTDSEVLLGHVFAQAVTFPADLEGSVAAAITAPAADPVIYYINRNGLPVAQFVFDTDGSFTFSTEDGEAVIFEQGDLLTLTVSATPDDGATCSLNIIGGYAHTGAGRPVSIGLSITVPMTDGEVLLAHVFDAATTFPADLVGSLGASLTAPEEDAVTYSIRKNGLTVAQIEFDTDGSFTFSTASASPVIFERGDLLDVPVSASPDDAARCSITLLGSQ